jgi:hypothetical protein
VVIGDVLELEDPESELEFDPVESVPVDDDELVVVAACGEADEVAPIEPS